MQAFQLCARSLCYEVRDQPLIDNLSFSVESGQALLIEGANGSGKTTLLSILCGLTLPDDGQITWNGKPINSVREHFCEELLYIGHTPGVKGELTAQENLQLSAALSANSAGNDLAAMEWVGLRGYERTIGSRLSFGQHRRVALARLYMSESRLWILDEPFSGLDTSMVDKLWDKLRTHVLNGGILVLTNHQPMDLETIPVCRVELGHKNGAKT